ncbi:hypothetical protein TNCV_2237161 [Trichonephila clavipes]|nr:hypothetical protein TNCV_2237161 [Trichonephila clavipes]
MIGCKRFAPFARSEKNRCRFDEAARITPPAATPDQLWQRVKAAWSAVPQEHIQTLFESTPRRIATVIFKNGGYSGY